MREAGSALFLDDVALWISHKDPTVAIRQLNSELSRIHSWSIFNTVCFDPKKFHLLDMGVQELPTELLDQVFFGDVNPSWCHNEPPKYLGLLVDNQLNFIDFMKHQAKRAFAAQFKVLDQAKEHVGCNVNILNILFCLYVLPILTYASELWIFDIKKYMFHDKSVHAKYRAAWNAILITCYLFLNKEHISGYH